MILTVILAWLVVSVVVAVVASRLFAAGRAGRT